MRNTSKIAASADAVLAMRPAADSLSWRRLCAQIAATRRIVREWRRRHRSRQELRALSAEEIRDFCLDRMVAEHEADKPFWRA
jgi:uncharacterized protein YjiS (DUF1127 family)